MLKTFRLHFALFALIGFHHVAAQIPSVLRIDINATQNKIALGEAAVIGPGKVQYGSWLKENAKYYLLTDQPVKPGEWTRVGLSFTPETSGSVRLTLLGKYLKDGEGKMLPVPVIWDSVQAEGCQVKNPDFEEADANGEIKFWTKTVSAQLPARVVVEEGQTKNGKRAVYGWHDANWSQDLEVTAGKPVKISVWAKIDDPSKPRFVKLDLSSAANMGFADETENDGKGGWTDQGSKNDLAKIKTGEIAFLGVDFFISPKEKSALLLRGPGRTYFPEQISVDVPKNTGMKVLYLLHGLAWTPKTNVLIGTLTTLSASGKVIERIPVVKGVDVADWWSPGSLKNGAVALTLENKSAYVGLYLSAFPLNQTEPIAKIVFESTGAAVWGIAGITLSDRSVPLPEKKIVKMAANEEWAVFKLEKEIVPGSALDFSFLLEGPAGKHGAVKTSAEGRFVFEDGKPAKFSGNNLSLVSSLLDGLTDEEISKLADRFARMGYNLIRFTYIDNTWLKPGDKMTVDEAGVTKLDRLAFELKKRGIYYGFDFLMGRRSSQAVNALAPSLIKRKGDVRDYLKAGFFIHPEIRKEVIDFAKIVMTHVNPLTGLAWKDDPALAYLGSLNEDPIPNILRGMPELQTACQPLWTAWLKNKYADNASLDKAWGGLLPGESLEKNNVGLIDKPASGTRGADVVTFFAGLQTAGVRELESELRKLGARQALSDVNMVRDTFTTLVRDELNFVDQHAYHDHPQFPEGIWGLPYSFHTKSAMKRTTWSYYEPGVYLASSRHWGKPYMVTEYDYCFPNPWRVEAGLLFAAMAAFQDWDGVLNFNYSFHREDLFDEYPAKYFDKVNEPIGLFGERMVKLLFLRGDLAPAKKKINLEFDPQLLAKEGLAVDEAANLLAYLGAVGLGKTDPSKDASYGVQSGKTGSLGKLNGGNEGLANWLLGARHQILPTGNQTDLEKGRVESAGSEILLDVKEPRLVIDTPRTRGFIGSNRGVYETKGVKAEVNAGIFSLSLSSLDAEPLESSSRILIGFPTDVRNRNMSLEDDGKKLISWGEAPLLFRTGEAKVELKENRNLKLFAIATSGRRIAEIPVEHAGGILKFKLAHRLGSDTVMYWELAEK